MKPEAHSSAGRLGTQISKGATPSGGATGFPASSTNAGVASHPVGHVQLVSFGSSAETTAQSEHDDLGSGQTAIRAEMRPMAWSPVHAAFRPLHSRSDVCRHSEAPRTSRASKNEKGAAPRGTAPSPVSKEGASAPASATSSSPIPCLLPQCPSHAGSKDQTPLHPRTRLARTSP